MSASKKRQKVNINKKRMTIFLFIAAVLLASVVSASAYTLKVLTYDKVYNGVYVEDTHVGGMTEDELRAKITELHDFSLVYDIQLNVGDKTESISTLALSPVLDIDGMTEKAFTYGREKRGLSRLGEIKALKKNPVSVPYSVMLDEFALQKVLDRISAELDITAVDNKIEIGTDALIITRGSKGRGIVYDEVKSAISECLLKGEKSVTIALKEIDPEPITLDFIKRHTAEKPVDATYTIANHRLIVTESSPGIVLNEKSVKRALEDSNNSPVITVPAKIKQPDVTTESLRESLLGDELGRFSSDFSSSTADRAYNIQLACEKIDGYILAPGEEFSYNEVVGPRTVERGFRMANVYVGNTVQPGIGGGICQVSSTMFNAAVYADLEITERRNHTLPVTYVPMGRDATVSYGAVDFKFKNTYTKPIEIRAICEGRKNIIIINGCNEHPERKIEIQTEKTGTSAPKVVKKEDATLPEGEIKIESPGTNGSSYIAYKIVYENGEKKSSNVLCKSTYKGKDRVEIIGTQKAPEPSPSPSPVVTPSAKPSEVPETTTPTKTPPESTTIVPQDE